MSYVNNSYYKKGEWNFYCDVCGFKKKSGEGRKRWDGLMVCKEDWEMDHPQKYLKVREDSQDVPWVRVEDGNPSEAGSTSGGGSGSETTNPAVFFGLTSISNESGVAGQLITHTITFSQPLPVAIVAAFEIDGGTAGVNYSATANSDFSNGVTLAYEGEALNIPAGVTSFTFAINTIPGSGALAYTISIGSISGTGTITGPVVDWTFTDGVNWAGESDYAFTTTENDAAYVAPYLTLTCDGVSNAFRDYNFTLAPVPTAGGFNLEVVVRRDGTNPGEISPNVSGLGINFVAISWLHTPNQLRLFNIFGTIDTFDMTGLENTDVTLRLLVEQTSSTEAMATAYVNDVEVMQTTGLVWTNTLGFDALQFYGDGDTLNAISRYRTVTFEAYEAIF